MHLVICYYRKCLGSVKSYQACWNRRLSPGSRIKTWVLQKKNRSEEAEQIVWGLSLYWMFDKDGPKRRDLILRIGQNKNKNISYLNESTFRVEGITLLSNLSVPPSELSPQMLIHSEKEKTLWLQSTYFFCLDLKCPHFLLQSSQCIEFSSLWPPAQI